jgi:hypothetical protein
MRLRSSCCEATGSRLGNRLSGLAAYVVLRGSWVLLLRAKHLFVAATRPEALVWVSKGLTWRRNSPSSGEHHGVTELPNPMGRRFN